MFCKLLKFLIEHAPTDAIGAKLQAVYDEHCSTDGGATTDSGGGGNGGKDPDQ